MSPSQLSTRRLLELMRDLQRIATHRHAETERIAEEAEQGLARAKSNRDAAVERAEEAFARQKDQADAVADSRRHELEAAYDEERGKAQQEYHGLRSAAESDRRQTSEEANRRRQDEALLILSTFDAQKGQPKRRRDEYVAQLKTRRQELRILQNDAAEILQSRRLTAPEPPPAEPGEEPAPHHEENDSDYAAERAMQQIESAVGAARDAVQALYDQRLGRLCEPLPLSVCALLGAALAAVPVGMATGWAPAATIASGAASAGLVFAALWFVVRRAAQKRADAVLERFLQAEAEAAAAIERAASVADARSRRESRELIERRDRDVATLGLEIDQLLSSMESRTGDKLQHAGEHFPARLSEMRREHEAAVAAVEAELRDRLGTITEARDKQIAEADEACRAAQEEVEQRREQQWQAMRTEWLAGYSQIADEVQAIRETCDRLFPDWRGTDYAAWEKPGEVSRGVEFGRAALPLASVKHGMPTDERLHPHPTLLEMPAMVTLTEQPSMVITAEGAGRRHATELMQAMMLRWITCQPPGKVRFTLLDPVGLGEAFNAMMHLADYDEGLIATRIWSEPRDIDEQLARLTRHMETVIQKFLRSEFDSIHEYNAQAGEVAEPLQVLVVSGFPANFSDDTARRLVSLATGGPRCGVYVMMSIDNSQRMPLDFPRDDLLADAVHLDWLADEGRFVWQYPAFGKLPLELADPPPPERMVELMKQVGQAARDAVRVEVPFDVVAAEQAEVWSRGCADELLVPIGRAGANRVQNVRLGKGTSQHLLVAGKTGSGKSTFLHALVTSAAMHYSPDEVEFYLVDFKKGVEFKSYATHNLPHARVVAIESEREFGLSVLERLDAELSRRGELYRESGVQTLADYRDAHPGQPMPRILLIIDEFQELFVEDDKLAQQSTLLLDRLVRQGRAFGMHVVLGTQTLAGAFSIARSTLGQIAVRVALECSEADAHLILNDERNTAARYLSRPGEAIYNDQNGLATANELFQVVWLPDRERAERLAQISDKRASAGMPHQSMVVFEGNAPADPSQNEMLQMQISRVAEDGVGMRNEAEAELGSRPARHSAFRNPNSAFLGDAVAIKPPTAVTFGRHGGSNLLIVGADERSALGMMTVGAISLSASDPAPRFVVLDATRAGDPSEGVWQRVADVLPEGTTVADAAGAAGAIADVAAEVARREAESDDSAPPVYLVIYNAGRFRDLRRTEDDFSFSMDKDKPASPDKQLAEILKSGPGVGVHTLVWCDSYNAASRLFDRMALREFALRVVMQMSAADSSNLIDTPAASHLNPHRALFYSDETGETEKLRPYDPPSAEWLESLSVGSAVRSVD